MLDVDKTMKLNIRARHYTRKQLAEWSALTLPAAALEDLPASVVDAARDPRDLLRVPALTYEQIRTVERHGLLDDYALKLEDSGLVVALWQARKRGDTRLYSTEHLFLCRLIAWALHAGVTMQEVLSVLKSACVSITFTASTADSVVVVRHARTVNGSTVDAEHLRAWHALVVASSPVPALWVFRLAYLGMRATLPKLQKMLDREPLVTRWNREWLPAQLTVAQSSESLDARM